MLSSIGSVNSILQFYSKTSFFSPTQITSLNNWYDASDPNGNGTIPTNGSSVTTWKDKSTNANHMLAQTAGTYATNNLNGLGTITCNQSWYRATTANAPYPMDAYVVVKLNSITTPVDVLGSGSKTVDNFNSLTFGEHTTSRWQNGSTVLSRTPNAVASSTYSETSTSFLLMSWSIANSNFYIYRNGVQIVYTNTYTWTPSSDNEYRIGARANFSTPNNMQGSIAEILFFNTQLITADRQKIEGYLAQKWGLQTSLPTNHPYNILQSQPYTELRLYTTGISAVTPITSITDLGTNPQTINVVAGTGNGVAYQTGNYYTANNLGKIYPVFFDSFGSNTANNINFSFIDQSQFTISLWVLIGAPNYAISNFFRINNGTSDVLVMNASKSTNNMTLTTSGFTITTPYTQNSVNYHIVFTINKTSGITLYKNGASVGSANGSITFTGSAFTAYLQGYGQIFNFKYFNYILSQTEISYIYNTET